MNPTRRPTPEKAMPRNRVRPPAAQTTPAPPRREAGFNFIEVVVAVGMLFLIAMMMLPIFSRATNLNLQGRESTLVAAYGRATQEDLAQLPFDSPRLTITAGSELNTTEVWVPQSVTSSNPSDPLDPSVGEWLDPSAVGGRTPIWQRDIRVRQYSVNDISEDGEFDNPLPSGTDPNFVHLKEVQVTVQGTRETGGPLGRSKDVVLTRVKAF
jgi:type II secretory pathway pseudopilin PulG